MGPDGVLYHINGFLDYIRKSKFQDFTDKLVDESKRSLIDEIHDYKDHSLDDEANRFWNEVKGNNGAVDFNRSEKKINALKNVTKESVQAWFNKIFFEEPRRINLKLYSYQHWI